MHARDENEGEWLASGVNNNNNNNNNKWHLLVYCSLLALLFGAAGGAGAAAGAAATATALAHGGDSAVHHVDRLPNERDRNHDPRQVHEYKVTVKVLRCRVTIAEPIQGGRDVCLWVVWLVVVVVARVCAVRCVDECMNE